MKPINVPEWVENESAYVQAAQARIRANRLKGWIARTPRAQEAADFLKYDETARGEFLRKMYERIENYGALSTGQLAAVLKIKDEAAQARAARHTALEGGLYVGKPGERVELTLTIERMKRTDDPFTGVRYVFACKTPDGAAVVYYGSAAIAANVGDVVKVRATIKEHGQYKGAAQTIIQRPKVGK